MSYNHDIYKNWEKVKSKNTMRIYSLRRHRLEHEWNQTVWSINNLRRGTAGPKHQLRTASQNKTSLGYLMACRCSVLNFPSISHSAISASMAARTQPDSAAVSRLTSGALSRDFTSSMTDSAFCAGHFANSALPLNLSATSS